MPKEWGELAIKIAACTAREYFNVSQSNGLKMLCHSVAHPRRSLTLSVPQPAPLYPLDTHTWAGGKGADTDTDREIRLWMCVWDGTERRAYTHTPYPILHISHVHVNRL